MTNNERINLGSLKPGDSLQVKTGPEPLFTYDVRVVEAGEMPKCEITQKNEQGEVTARPTLAILEGTGHWTTPEQNPMQLADWSIGRQRQDKAMSIDYGGLNIGGFLVVREPEKDASGRIYLTPECTEFTHHLASK